jgi:3-phenylpropionate/cinnamic acid dioxygenase small subunit
VTSVLALDSLRDEIESLYLDYVEALDEDRLEDWPSLFIAEGSYQVVSRENWLRGLPLATMRCDSRDMMLYRIDAIRASSMYVPRTMRHIVSSLRAVSLDDRSIGVRANYAVFETLPGELTRVFSAGVYRDRLLRDGDRLRFAEKLCVYDSTLVPNSLVYPIEERSVSQPWNAR